ncbi:uncharacterized protein LOC124161052 [Ischnura elegans]|uniref:uncharacterized protein LOC124161052 n=1 Tax=Ischnura elegans TaxID=197161 RepID=UPI001ED89918|nr:uncharacterized protein LOC124161052 [Ischnura elegans]XP_046393169.1 uncharacterized protein LOC124161052 [Ischnura elegans]
MEAFGSQDAEASDSGVDCSDLAPTDSALVKRATDVKEKYQDDAYSWIMLCLEMIFEYFDDKDARYAEVENLSDGVLELCMLQLNSKRAQDVFRKLCCLHPVKSCPREFDFTEEFDKLMAKEPKVKENDAKKHPKFIKFTERVKELERGKQLSQREAIAVD